MADTDEFLAFDPSVYTRAPMFTLPNGMALVQGLLAARPAVGLSAGAKKAAQRLESGLKTAQAAWAERQRLEGLAGPEDTRALDQSADGCWAGLRMRLEALTYLSTEEPALAERAAKLLKRLFGTGGLGFLKESYSTQWATMDTLLKRIDDEKLAKELDALAGPEFLKAIRLIHPRYQAMVEAVLRRDDSARSDLRAHVRALARAVVDYASKVVALADADDPDSVDLVRKALRPIEQLREWSSDRRASTEASDEPAPATPTPTPPTS